MRIDRIVAIALVALFSSLSVFAVNDFWLGSSFSVALAIETRGGQGVEAPKPQLLPMPVYPIDLMMAGLQGKAVIQFSVLMDGTVSDVVVSRCDFEAFGVEAKKAVEKFSFTPAMDRRTLGGTSVPMLCTFSFTMAETKRTEGRIEGKRPDN